MGGMTKDQGRYVLEGERNDERAKAAQYRRMAEDCRRAASDCDDADLRRYQFHESTRWLGMARECDYRADAIDAVLESPA